MEISKNQNVASTFREFVGPSDPVIRTFRFKFFKSKI